MKNQIQQRLLFTAFAAACVALQACKPDENPCKNCESELITSVYLLATDSATSAQSVFAYRDPDGDGGNAPVRHDTVQLQQQHTYLVQLLLLDESKTPADTISNEVLEEAEDHQVFYTLAGLSGFAIGYEDADANSLPVGLLTRWRSGAAGTGSLQLTLKHQPGTKNGSITTGETDMDLPFTVIVE